MRRPETIYQNISPNVPTWQYTGAGNINSSISNITSTGAIDFDIDGSDPNKVIQFEQDLLGTATNVGGINWLAPLAPNGNAIYIESIGARGGFTVTVALPGQLTTLNRTMPAKHPIRPYMRASHIQGVQGLANTGKVGGDQATWKIIRYSTQFETLPYWTLQNPQANDANFREWNRFLSLDSEEQSNEFQKRPYPGAFTLPDNAGLIQPVIKENLKFLTVKKRLKFTWHQVPDDGLFRLGGWMRGGKAPQIDYGLGRVNLHRWHDYNPGTLLFESWRAILRPQPCNPLSQVVPFDAPDTIYPVSWDVEFTFLYFEPIIDVNYYAQYNETIENNVFGHNCLPNPLGTNVWYRAFTNPQVFAGAADIPNCWLYNVYDFDWLFAIWRPPIEV